MTIGIGVLASGKEKSDHLILMADTKGSFDNEYSMNRLHKIFAFPNEKIYATAADRIDRSAELVTLIDEHFKSEKPDGYGSTLLVINRALYAYREQRFGIEVAPRFWTQKADLETGTIPHEIRAKIEAEWPNFHTRAELIIGTFGPNGQAYLFSITEDALENNSVPGFVAIGSGSGNAMFWLCHRNQHLGRSLKQSAYHAFEAKLMAESSPFVNEKLDILVANSSEHFLLTDFKPAPKGAPFTAEELRAIWPKYGPQSTDEIA
jgi:hypothetical protein